MVANLSVYSTNLVRQKSEVRVRQPDRTPFGTKVPSTGQNTVLPAHSGLRPPFTTEERIRSVTRNCPIRARAAGPASRNMHNGRDICRCEFAELPSDLPGSETTNHSPIRFPNGRGPANQSRAGPSCESALQVTVAFPVIRVTGTGPRAAQVRQFCNRDPLCELPASGH